MYHVPRIPLVPRQTCLVVLDAPYPSFNSPNALIAVPIPGIAFAPTPKNFAEAPAKDAGRPSTPSVAPEASPCAALLMPDATDTAPCAPATTRSPPGRNPAPIPTASNDNATAFFFRAAPAHCCCLGVNSPLLGARLYCYLKRLTAMPSNTQETTIRPIPTSLNSFSLSPKRLPYAPPSIAKPLSRMAIGASKCAILRTIQFMFTLPKSHRPQHVQAPKYRLHYHPRVQFRPTLHRR